MIAARESWSVRRYERLLRKHAPPQRRGHAVHDAHSQSDFGYRFAFSVIWEMTPAGVIVDVDFCKSIIHSVAGLTYNEAQLMLDDPNIQDVKAESVRRLNDLAKIFRKRRMDSGALTLASPEVQYCVPCRKQHAQHRLSHSYMHTGISK